MKDPHGSHVEGLLSLALAHYRAGQWEKAVDRVEEALALHANLPSLGWPILAMAHFKLGHADEAQRWLQKAEQWHRQEGRRLAEESAGFAPAERADFEILLREATSLIGER